MKLETLFIGLLLFSAIIIGMSQFNTAIIGTYMPGNASTDLSTLNRNTTVASYLTGTASSLRNSTSIVTIVWTIPALIWGVFMMFLEIPSIFLGIMHDINTIALGGLLPDWFVSTIFLIITAFIIFKVIGAIRGTET